MLRSVYCGDSVTEHSLGLFIFFDYSGIMETLAASAAFATLGHPDRLAVFRLMMRFAPRGIRPTEIAQTLGMKQNTLSHHLADLVASGLVQVQRKGRSLFYAVNLSQTKTLIGYLALDVGRARADLLAPMQDRCPKPTSLPNVLFICSGNSARSIFAEALLRDLGKGQVIAHSAGTRPGTGLNPMALSVLRENGHPVVGLRAKHIAEYHHADAPKMDFVFTVCDTAASEECPPWPGHPITGHWGLADPVQVSGPDTERARLFAATYGALRQRISAFVELPLGTLDRIALQKQVDAIDAAALTLVKD
jgi:ArsR family transcriptional regulator, arsenate/arsenite/antimonite-responsive transcriptional repressor / arsenate reductase (thioredoxin)